jgi:hypothetical protein
MLEDGTGDIQIYIAIGNGNIPHIDEDLVPTAIAHGHIRDFPGDSELFVQPKRFLPLELGSREVGFLGVEEDLLMVEARWAEQEGQPRVRVPDL